MNGIEIESTNKVTNGQGQANLPNEAIAVPDHNEADELPDQHDAINIYEQGQAHLPNEAIGVPVHNEADELPDYDDAINIHEHDDDIMEEAKNPA